MLQTVPHDRIVITRTINGWIVEEVWDHDVVGGEETKALVNQWIYTPGEIGDLLEGIKLRLKSNEPVVGDF